MLVVQTRKLAIIRCPNCKFLRMLQTRACFVWNGRLLSSRLLAGRIITAKDKTFRKREDILPYAHSRIVPRIRASNVIRL